MDPAATYRRQVPVSRLEAFQTPTEDVYVIAHMGIAHLNVVAARIRASEKGVRHMRLIALTGYGTEQDRQRAADAGFDAHLTKPVEPQRLAMLLATAA